MAIRFDTAGERLERTTDLLDYNAAYTVMLWARPVGWSSGTWAGIISVAYIGYSDFDGLAIDDAFDEWMPFAAKASSWDVDQSSPVGAAVNTWVHLALVRESATVLKAYADGALIATVTTASVSGRNPATFLRIGDTPGADGVFNGRVAYVKAWSAGLTIDEVAAEMRTIAPRRMTNLYGWWPTWGGATERARDYSGNARAWTETGTLTDEDPPPVSWGAGVLWLPFAATTQTVSPDAIASTASLGSLTVTPGVVTVSPTGIASTAALGSLTVTSAATIAPAGVASGAALGSLTVTATATIAPTGISSTAALGTPTVTASATVSPDGIASGASVGSVTVTAAATVSPDGIASSASLGTVTVTGGEATIAPTGITSTAALGSVTVTPGDVTRAVDGIASTAQVGSPTVTTAAAVSVGGIASTASLGNVAVTPGTATVAPTGIGSTASLGSVTVQGGAVSVSPAGIASTASVGAVAVASVYEVLLTAIESAAATGTPTITTGPVTLSPVGIASTALLGVLSVGVGNLQGRLSVGNAAVGTVRSSSAGVGGVVSSDDDTGGLSVADT